MKATSGPDELLFASVGQPAVERRRRNKRVRTDRRQRQSMSVGLEVSPTGLSLTCVVGEEEERRLITRRVEFAEGSGPTRGDFSDGTIDEVLQQLANELHLNGQSVSIALGGAPCVTRFLAGDNEDVDAELEELTRRTAHYIGMGLGDKVTCKTEKSLDARRKRVWVTVARRDFVASIATAVQKAGMRVARIEHTMVVLSRLLNLLAKDEQGPVLMIVDELGRLNLGISYRGRLMLDYRPAMPDASASHGSIVQRHLKCLRRYIRAQLPEVADDLEQVYLTGLGESRDSLSLSLEEQSDLTVCRFPTEHIYGELELDGEVSEDPGVLASVSLATYSFFNESDKTATDLASTLHTTGGVSWFRLLSTTWPISLACAAAIMLFLHGGVVDRSVKQAEAEIEAMSLRRVEANVTRLNIEQRRQKGEHTQALLRKLPKPQWARAMWKTGMSLPDQMWLQSIQFNHRRQVYIVGSCYSDESVFEFIETLRACGLYDRVALDGTKSVRGNEGSMFQFEISARLRTSVAAQGGQNVAAGWKGNGNG